MRPAWARAGLALLALLLIAAAVVPITAGDSPITSSVTARPSPSTVSAAASAGATDVDFYRHVVARLRAGESYYDFIVTTQRNSDYPVRPGLAVRLPTLATIQAALGEIGTRLAGAALVAALIASWWWRLGREGMADRRLAGCAFVFLCAALALNPAYLPVHELWAGLLAALALALYRPPPRDGPGSIADWLPAFAILSLGLAIREHILPFVLLLAATALWRRRWTEAAAWAALVIVFVAGLTLHLHMVAGHTLPSDRLSPSWLTFRGLSGVLSPVVLSTALHYLPHWLSGPIIVFAFLGWVGWNSPLGRIGAALFLGYALIFAVAGRPNNFYWGLLLAPGLFLGLAFAPSTAKSLFRAAFAR